MTGLAALAGVVQIFAGLAYPANAAYAVLFFTLGAHPQRLLRGTGLVGATVVAFVAGVYPLLHGVDGERSDVRLSEAATLAVGAGLVTLGGWTVGYIQWLNRRAVQAEVDARLDAAERTRLRDVVDQEQVRTRIAADMHDVVAHSWAVVAAQADGARYSLGRSPEAAERALEVIGETARSTIADLRVILKRLRNQEAESTSATTPGPEHQRELFARMRASGLDLHVTELGVRSDSPLILMTAHRLLGEALTNALKHGDQDAPVDVRQDWLDGYRLQVANSVAAGGAHVETGHGIVGMQERAALAGGTVTSSQSGERWVVTAYLPAPDRPESKLAEERR
jgi:signal transduction histidine kinase